MSGTAALVVMGGLMLVLRVTGSAHTLHIYSQYIQKLSRQCDGLLSME